MGPVELTQPLEQLAASAQPLDLEGPFCRAGAGTSADSGRIVLLVFDPRCARSERTGSPWRTFRYATLRSFSEAPGETPRRS